MSTKRINYMHEMASSNQGQKPDLKGMLQSNLNRKNMFFFTYIAIKTSLTILFFKDNITVKMLPELRPNSEFYFGDIRIRVSNERNVSHKNAKNTKIFVRISQTFWMNFRKDLAFFFKFRIFFAKFSWNFRVFCKKSKIAFSQANEMRKNAKIFAKIFFSLEPLIRILFQRYQNSIQEISEFYFGEIETVPGPPASCSTRKLQAD